METFLRILMPAAVVVTTAAGAGCLVVYHVKSRGAWRKTQFGIHLMSFMAGLEAVLLLALISQLWGGWQESAARPYVRAGVWVFIACLFVWRLIVFWRSDRMLLPREDDDQA